MIRQHGVIWNGIRPLEPDEAIGVFACWAGAMWPASTERLRPELVLVDARHAIRPTDTPERPLD